MLTQRIEAIVRRLAQKYFEIEAGIERVVWFKNGGKEEIHLILVNRNTFPEGRILPFYHRPTREIPLPVQIGDITPEEWKKTQSGRIPLPEGWYWDDLEILEREEVGRESTAAIGADKENSTCSTQPIEELVLRFVRKHFEIEPGIERIIWLKDGLQEEVRLLEVNRDALPAGKIMPFYCKPTLDFPLSLWLADATPEEWEKVKGGELLLPEWWSLRNAQIFERTEVLQEASAALTCKPKETLGPLSKPVPAISSLTPLANKEKLNMPAQRIEEIVRRMAREHFEVEESIERIIWFKDAEKKEIHLIEVNRDIFPEGMILLFYHKPTAKFPLPARIADVTPEEWEKVKNGVIPLPEGWSLDDVEILEREEVLQFVDANLRLEEA